MTGPERYRPDLALVHDLGFGGHADRCAPGILRRLEPVRRRKGLVVELGCGSGALTRHLVDAGHRVVATDASPAMVDLARRRVPDADDFRLLTLPDDPMPAADAVVSVGHVLNYLPDVASVDRALVAAARALRPGGVLAVDLCDREWGATRHDAAPAVRVTDAWAVISRTSVPARGSSGPAHHGLRPQRRRVVAPGGRGTRQRPRRRRRGPGAPRRPRDDGGGGVVLRR